MKKILLFLFFISTTFVGKGQNLVPNGDFEGYSSCPTNPGQINCALFWFSANYATPTYYNQCASGNIISIPINTFGFQPSHSGNGYVGIIQWYALSEYREYISVPILSALTAGTCYHFEMYINLGNDIEYTTDALGIYFSDSLINMQTTSQSLPFSPQINNTIGNIPDTINWTLVSGNFISNGGENYMIIGNFKNDANTSVTLVNNLGIYYAYIYIDDVSLTPCTGIEGQNQNSGIKIYPNPVSDELKVSGLKFKVGDEIKVFDLMGKEVLKSIITNPQSEIKIDMRSFSKGVYFIKVNTSGMEEIKKVIKIE